MTNVRGYAFLQDFTLKIKELPKRNEENCLFGFLLQNRKVYFPPIRIGCPYDVELVTTRVRIRGLKSSTEVQLPIVSGNLTKMLHSCLCTSFVSCYCVLTEKIDQNGSIVTIDPFSCRRVGSLLV